MKGGFYNIVIYSFAAMSTQKFAYSRIVEGSCSAYNAAAVSKEQSYSSLALCVGQWSHV